MYRVYVFFFFFQGKGGKGVLVRFRGPGDFKKGRGVPSPGVKPQGALGGGGGGGA